MKAAQALVLAKIKERDYPRPGYLKMDNLKFKFKKKLEIWNYHMGNELKTSSKPWLSSTAQLTMASYFPSSSKALSQAPSPPRTLLSLHTVKSSSKLAPFSSLHLLSRNQRKVQSHHFLYSMSFPPSSSGLLFPCRPIYFRMSSGISPVFSHSCLPLLRAPRGHPQGSLTSSSTSQIQRTTLWSHHPLQLFHMFAT